MHLPRTRTFKVRSLEVSRPVVLLITRVYGREEQTRRSSSGAIGQRAVLIQQCTSSHAEVVSSSLTWSRGFKPNWVFCVDPSRAPTPSPLPYVPPYGRVSFKQTPKPSHNPQDFGYHRWVCYSCSTLNSNQKQGWAAVNFECGFS